MVEGHWQVMANSIPIITSSSSSTNGVPGISPAAKPLPATFSNKCPRSADAVFSGMTLDIFNRHPEKVAMANCAQLINCLNSLYLAHEDRFVVTTVGRAFELYTPHPRRQFAPHDFLRAPSRLQP